MSDDTYAALDAQKQPTTGDTNRASRIGVEITVGMPRPDLWLSDKTH